VKLIRQFSPDRVNTAIYTHGHVDHACGMPAIVADAQKNKVARRASWDIGQSRRVRSLQAHRGL